MSAESSDCDPLTLTRKIEDFPIGNLPLSQHHRLLCHAPFAGLSIHPHAWLDPKDAALFTDPEIRTLIDGEGTVLAWLGESPDLSRAAPVSCSFLIRHPWDLLKANEQFVSSLASPLIAGDVHPSAVIEGVLHLGHGTRILPGVFIEGNVIIGANCKIGPNCYIRGNTSIGDGCHIGQSVEIKNCLILSKTNVGHLSYIGDSVLGEKVNLGAGTTTSNLRHDGKNHRSLVNGVLIDTGRRKFGAIFGDGVHTGINTSIYPGRKLWPATTTRPGEIVERDLQSQISNLKSQISKSPNHMCGIVGYIGKADATTVLINGLRRLEYRGYDSAGVAILDDDRVVIAKSPGKVSALSDRARKEWPADRFARSTMGIAHTRWATHGPPTEVNAHPHLDGSGEIALVHNGIIENYRSLRARMEGMGHHFYSETDTEVLAHLIGDCDKGDLFQAVCDALHQVEGTFGIAVLSAREPEKIITARRGSPIVIGVGDGETIIASDASAILAHTQRVIYLDDNDIAIVTADSVDIRDLNNIPVTREIAELGYDAAAAEKGGFEHFMLKEIHEQPEALSNAIRGRLDFNLGSSVLAGMGTSPRELAELGRVVLVGCGTSLHAGLVGEYAFEDLADIDAEVQQAAEFRYRNPILGSRDLVVAISQSGETADTLAAVREANQKGAFVMSLCNVVGSTIARETGRGVYLHAGPEISVASTKAFTCQVAVLLMMALKLGRGRRYSREDGMRFAREIESVPALIGKVLLQNDRIAKIAADYAKNEHAFFIGRGPMYPVALEGALKLKEISYIHAEGYHAAELKHGPIALLVQGTPIIALAPDIPGKDKTLGNIEECRARGARILGIVTEGDHEAAECMDDFISIPRCHPLVATLPAVVALQLFSYHVARIRGCEIDQPRNLAKSVTVE